MNKLPYFIIFCFCLTYPRLVMSEDSLIKKSFSSEKYLHLKIGTTINTLNSSLFKSLNYPEINKPIFVSTYAIAYNPCVKIAFEYKFLKNFGLNTDFGFTQTRHHYLYDNDYKGSIICNIPNANIQPTVYIKNTRFMFGGGFYKYYFYFIPDKIGQNMFNFNIEGYTLTSIVSIMQVIKIKGNDVSLTASYFGLNHKFDNGFQFNLGLVL
jgi:hypothetical protein